MENPIYALLAPILIVGAVIAAKHFWTRFLERKDKLEDDREAKQDESISSLFKRQDEHAKRIWDLEVQCGEWISRKEAQKMIYEYKRELLEEFARLENNFRDHRGSFDKFKEAVNEKFFNLVQKLNPNNRG